METKLEIENNFREKAKEFWDYMNTKRVYGSDVPYTHVRIGPPPNSGKYNISDGICKAIFMKLYNKVYNYIDLNIAERISDRLVAPLMLDYDFRINGKERTYMEEDLERTCEIIHGKITTMLKISDYKMYVEEKPNPSYDKKKRNYKDGYHVCVMIPLTYPQRKYIFEEIKREMISCEMFKDIGCINSEKEIYDESTLKDNGWVLYGSRKTNGQRYEVTRMYKNGTMQDTWDDLVYELSVRRYDEDDYVDDNFSQETNDEIIREKDKMEDKLKKDKPYELLKVNKDTYMISKFTEDKFREIALNMNLKKFEEWGVWREWIFLCRNYNKKELCIEISKLSPGWDDKSLPKIEEIFKESPTSFELTEGTLIRWSQENDIEKHNQIMKDAYGSKAFTSLLMYEYSEHDMAEYILEYFKKSNIIFISSDEHNNIYTFYYFNGTRWILNTNELYTMIENKIPEKLEREITRFQKKLIEYVPCDDNNKNKIATREIKKIIRKIQTFVNKIKGANGIYKLIGTIGKITYDKKINEKLNMNPTLLGFEDGIYDLKEKKFRKGVPGDYVSFSVGYNFPKEKGKYYDSINTFLKEIYSVEDIRKYMLKRYAQSLSGNVGDNTIHTHVGEGSNGKSILCILLKATFGEYYYAASPELITMKASSANSPNPEKSQLIGIRLCAVQEPEKLDGPVRSGTVKAMSGDTLTGRKCNSNDMIKAKSMIHLHIFCNKMLNIDGTDGGLKRRIRVIKYTTKFVTEDEKHLVSKNDHVYLANEKLENVISEWKADFMLLLLENYEYDSKIITPEVIKYDSNEYMEDNDDMKIFLKETIEKGEFNIEENKGDYITVKELKHKYELTKDYKKLSLCDFKAELFRKIGRNVFYDEKRINIKKNEGIDEYECKKLYGVIIGWKFIDE